MTARNACGSSDGVVGQLRAADRARTDVHRGVLKTPDTDRPEDPEVIGRFQAALSTFGERFPEAGGIVQVLIDEDEDAESIVAKLASVQGADTPEQADAREDAINGVRQGRHPVAFLAGLVGRGTAETIIKETAHIHWRSSTATRTKQRSRPPAQLSIRRRRVGTKRRWCRLPSLPENTGSGSAASSPDLFSVARSETASTEASATRMGGEHVERCRSCPTAHLVSSRRIPIPSRLSGMSNVPQRKLPPCSLWFLIRIWAATGSHKRFPSKGYRVPPLLP